MSKGNNDALFALVRSLNKAEKRHFKIYSSRHVEEGGNGYVKLFDAIEAQRNYDEEHLKRKMTFSHFRIMKARLYNSVVRGLETFHSGFGMEIKKLLNQAEVLFDKSLFAQSHKHIRKAKLLAVHYELFELALEALRWELRIALKKGDRKLLQDILQEEKHILRLLNNQKVYRDQAMALSIRYNQAGPARNSRDLDSLKKILHRPFLVDEKKALSVRALQNFHDCRFLIAIMCGDDKAAYWSSSKMLEAYHAAPHLIYLYSAPYLININNFLVAVQKLKKFEEMKYALNKLSEIRVNMKRESEKTAAFFYSHHFLNYHVLTGTFEEAQGRVIEIEQEMKAKEKNLSVTERSVLYLSLAQVYFGQRNYAKCLYWISRIMQLGEIEERKDLSSYIRIFSLLVHFDAGSEPGFTQSLFRSTYRFLYKRERLFKLETLMMEFIGQNLVKENSSRSMKVQFLDLRSALKKLQQDPYENQEQIRFLYLWLESKMENKTFAEMVRIKIRSIEI